MVRQLALAGNGVEWRGVADVRRAGPAMARDTKAVVDVRMARDSLAPLRLEWCRLREVISYGGTEESGHQRSINETRRRTRDITDAFEARSPAIEVKVTRVMN
ncbi:unnamed protein product [Spodoptera exigua]|nr:unnamed protein product [Spodoptera exigua]